MWLPVAILAGGLLVGLVAGGHWRAVRTTQVRRWPVGALGLACTVLPWIGDQSWTTGVVAIGWALLIAFAIFNLHLTGMVIVAIGLVVQPPRAPREPGDARARRRRRSTSVVDEACRERPPSSAPDDVSRNRATDSSR